MPLIAVPPLQVLDSTGGPRLTPGTAVRIALADHAAELGIDDTTAVDSLRLRVEMLDHGGRAPSVAAVGRAGHWFEAPSEYAEESGIDVEAELDGEDAVTLRIAGDGPTHLRLTVVGYREWDQSTYVDESEVPPGSLPQVEPTAAEIDPGEAADLSIADTGGPEGTAPRVSRGDDDLSYTDHEVEVEVLADDDPEAIAAMADWDRAAEEEQRGSS